MGVVERGASRGSIAGLAVVVLLIGAVAFSLGRSTGSDDAGPPAASTTAAPSSSLPGTDGRGGTEPGPEPASASPGAAAPRATTTLLADPPVEAGCTTVPVGDVVACLQRQRDELEVLLTEATSAVEARSASIADELATATSDPTAAARRRDLDRSGAAAEGFRTYRDRACGWSAAVSVATVERLGSQDAAALACSNALTADRVRDLQRLVDGVPLADAVGWQHPMTRGRVCDPDDRLAENDPCGNPSLSEAEARLATVHRYLILDGSAAPLLEASGAWLRFEEDDCASRLALFADAGVVDRSVCTYESFVRYLAVVDDGYVQILSVE